MKILRDKAIVENKAIAPKKRRPMLFIFTILIFFIIYKLSLFNYFGMVMRSDAKIIIKDFEKNYLYSEVFLDKEYIKMKGSIINKPFTSKLKIHELISYTKQLAGDKNTKFSYADLMQGKASYSLYKKMIFQSKKLDKNTSYVKLSSFSESAEKKFQKAIEKMGNLDYLVLDLRGNQLGHYIEAIEIADDLLPGNLEIASIECSNSKHYFNSNDFFYDLKKIFILLDEESACNSELLALTLKENLNDKVELIGKKTKGMNIGSVYKTYYNKINFSIVASKWNVKDQASEELAKYLGKYKGIALENLEDYLAVVNRLKIEHL